MTNKAERLIAAAKADVGYLEKASDAKLDDKTANVGNKNYTKYGKWYGDNGAPWCAQSVSYWAAEAGISTTIIPKHESCGVGMRWFKEAGRWHARDGYTPEPADIIYYTHNGTSPAHEGIVTAVMGGSVYTVEGNTSGGSTLVANGGGVAEKNYPLTYSKILGYAHPDYIQKAATATETEDNMVRYNKLSDIPNNYGFQDIINTLMDAKIIKGDGSDKTGNDDVIDLSHDQVRTLVFIYRGGGFDKKLEEAGLKPAVE
jgi:hypothetical protein